jgi:hypothetical protein
MEDSSSGACCIHRLTEGVLLIFERLLDFCSSRLEVKVNHLEQVVRTLGGIDGFYIDVRNCQGEVSRSMDRPTDRASLSYKADAHSRLAG